LNFSAITSENGITGTPVENANYEVLREYKFLGLVDRGTQRGLAEIISNPENLHAPSF